MSFQNGAALAWLIPLAGIIILLYLLKMRRRDVRVPATFLWPARVEEIRANALFQKLRPNWLLFLQLLALALVCFGMARPQTQQKGLTGEITVLVLDSSASMSATDIAPSRFEEAKKLAKEAIQSSRAGDRLALIEAGATPKVIFPLGNDQAKQVRLLDAVKPTDSEGEVGDALRLAAALVGTQDGARIVLLSDGVFEKVTNFTRGKAALVYKSIGDQDDNLSISALGTAETATGRQLFCGIKNHSSKPIDGSLTLYADGEAIASTKVPGIAPNGQWGHTIAAPAGAKVFEAKLTASDMLKSDNYAVSINDPGASLRVLLVSKGNPFLEKALFLDPRVTLDRTTEVPPQEMGGIGGGTYDVVVFDGIEEQPVKARGVITFGSPGPSSPAKATGSAAKPQFLSAEKSDLMRGVDFEGVFIEKQTQVQPTATGKVQAETSAGPLVISSERPDKRQILVTFEPLNSDFPLQVGFPILLANALDFVAGGNSSQALAVKPGQPFSLPWTKEAQLTGPSGTHTLSPTGSTLVIREAKTVGKHALKLGETTKDIYVALKSDRESNIEPAKNLPLGGGEVKATQTPLRFADFWRPLALLALLVLAGEWWLFARRS
ncbi:MAG: BatA and WFA domain-containing protein [Fimbriimonas sp.]